MLRKGFSRCMSIFLLDLASLMAMSLLSAGWLMACKSVDFGLHWIGCDILVVERIAGKCIDRIDEASWIHSLLLRIS